MIELAHWILQASVEFLFMLIGIMLAILAAVVLIALFLPKPDLNMRATKREDDRG